MVLEFETDNNNKTEFYVGSGSKSMNLKITTVDICLLTPFFDAPCPTKLRLSYFDIMLIKLFFFSFSCVTVVARKHGKYFV
jgi:hypothetical protein